jgi:hypothetical protein
MKGNQMKKITPFLWFDNQAEEARKMWLAEGQVWSVLASQPRILGEMLQDKDPEKAKESCRQCFRWISLT